MKPKPVLFLLASFLLLFGLSSISTERTLIEVMQGQGTGSWLPSKLLFLGIAFLFLLLALVTTFIRFEKRFAQPIKLVRHNRDIRATLFLLVLVYGLLLGIAFIRKNYAHLSFYNHDYYVVVVVAYIVYEVLVQWRTKQVRPDAFALTDTHILCAKWWGVQQKPLTHVQKIEHDPKRNQVVLHFREGLDTITLPFSDFDKSAVELFVEQIKGIRGE